MVLGEAALSIGTADEVTHPHRSTGEVSVDWQVVQYIRRRENQVFSFSGV